MAEFTIQHKYLPKAAGASIIEGMKAKTFTSAETVTAIKTLPSAKEHPLIRTMLLRKIYRVLLNAGRTYAAFTQKEFKLVESLREKKEILDPMSGYGSLTRYCAELGLKSYCVEFNLPQYLWQVLCKPTNVPGFIKCCQLILSWRSRWPHSSVRAIVSDEWFPKESQTILCEMLELSRSSVKKSFDSADDFDELALALLIPFVGRLSCSVPGDIVTHTKKGGVCVYRDWEEDYNLYLLALLRRLEMIAASSVASEHTIVRGDARTIKLPKKRFGGVLNSPPYPNHRDFVSMFAPEHAFLDLLEIPGSITSRRASEDIIGSNFVADRPYRTPTTKAAKQFLKAITELKRNETAIRHDRQYYIPYFEHYFADLEQAYKNISPSLKDEFEGYIIVVNNTHRNLLVPVSDVILEIWKSLDFNATVFDSNEYFHIGTKNPRARGLRARHTEYVIKVWR